MVKKILVFLLVSVLLMLGCASPVLEDNPRIGYLPDGRMVLLQSSGEDKPVEFPDANLELVVRETLESIDTLAAGEPVYTTDLEEIVYLEASSRGITDLKGLENCINLGFLDLSGNEITDLSPIGSLPGALVYSTTIVDGREIVLYRSYLDIKLNKDNLTDISALKDLVSPDELTLFLSFNKISDLSPVSKLTNLIGLYLCENSVSDLSPLSNLTNLVNLELWRNQIEDISPLAGLTNLAWLELFGNHISDITPLKGLYGLDSLQLGCNQIEVVSPLATLINLRYLNLANNQIRDASALVVLKNTEINLEGNPLEGKP